MNHQRPSDSVSRIAIGSTLVVFDNLGHIPHEEDPARTALPVRDFLATLPGATPPPQTLAPTAVPKT